MNISISSFYYKSKLLAVLFSGLLLLIFTQPVAGQKSKSSLQVSPYTGYVVGGKIRVSTGDLSVNDSQNYGIFVEFPVQRQVNAEFYYSYQPTYMNFWHLRDGTTEKLFDMDVHYFMLSGHYEYPTSNNIIWFGSFGLGASIFSPKNTIEYSDEWRFTVNLGGGAKIFFSDIIGIRLQALMNIPIQWGGTGFYFGSGGGGLSVGGGSTFVQGNFLAGLVFRL